MITNDMKLFDEGTKCIYTLFLNKLGRILYDSIIYKKSNEEFLIECDSEISSNLVRHLKLYRVRRKVDIHVSDEHDLYCLRADSKIKASDKISIYEDPRLKDIGQRIVTSKDYDLKNDLKGIEEGDINEYTSHRYKFGVGEGIVDLIPEKSFPLESNCDYMNGVSFHKGCYIGQELTARTHHTGVIRKRLMPVIFEKSISVNLSEVADVKDEQKKSVGKLRNISGVYALGLMRVEQALAAKELNFNENPCRVEKPSWWPNAN
jgi:folate-binding protein YgfZ